METSNNGNDDISASIELEPCAPFVPELSVMHNTVKYLHNWYEGEVLK